MVSPVVDITSFRKSHYSNEKYLNITIQMLAYLRESFWVQTSHIIIYWL